MARLRFSTLRAERVWWTRQAGPAVGCASEVRFPSPGGRSTRGAIAGIPVLPGSAACATVHHRGEPRHRHQAGGQGRPGAYGAFSRARSVDEAGSRWLDAFRRSRSACNRCIRGEYRGSPPSRSAVQRCLSSGISAVSIHFAGRPSAASTGKGALGRRVAIARTRGFPAAAPPGTAARPRPDLPFRIHDLAEARQIADTVTVVRQERRRATDPVD